MSPSSVKPSPPKKKPTEAARRKRPAARMYVDVELCKGCGFCVEFCPTGALELSDGYNKKGYHPPVVTEDDCLYCEICEVVCPEFSIYCVEDPEAVAAEKAVPTAQAPTGNDR